MPIEVRHESNGSAALDAALALFLAQQKQQEEVAQQAPNILDQLAPLLAERRNGTQPGIPGGQEQSASGPPQSYSGGPPQYHTAGQPQYRTEGSPQPQYTFPGHGSGRAYGGRGSSDSSREALAQFNAQQLAEREAADDARAAELHAMDQAGKDQATSVAHANAMSLDQLNDSPEWIQKGMSDGSLKYSPAQLRDRQQRLDAIEQAYRNPAFSPEDVARFEARQREVIRRIDLSPQPVPFNERPVTTQQQFEQGQAFENWTKADGSQGKIPVMPQNRAEGVIWVPTPNGKLMIEKDKIDYDHKKKVELEAIKAANADKDYKAKSANRNSILSRRDNLSKYTHEAYVNWQEAEANFNKYMRGKQTDADGNTLSPEQLRDVLDDAERARKIAEERYRSLGRDLTEVESDLHQVGGTQQNVDPSGGNVPTGMDEMNGPAEPQLPPPVEPAEAQQMLPVAPPLAAHPEDGVKAWMQVGINEKTVLPNGQRVIKRGPTEYEPVE